jgi:MATE family multidrug resistance protein
MVYSVIAYWAVGMSLGAYLTFSQGLGPKGMWMGIIAGLTVASVLLGGRFIRVSKDTIDQQA